MERIGFHPRAEEEEYEEEDVCLGIGSLHAVSEEEAPSPYPRLALFFEIVQSNYVGAFAQGALFALCCLALAWCLFT
jgi:hypothetical protein